MKPDHLVVEQPISSQRIFSGDFLQINRDVARLPNGENVTREYIVHPGASMVIPLREDGRVLVEAQFRYPLQAYFIEFPAGKIDPNEGHLTCAKRELLEETGYAAHDHDWHYLAPIHNAIAYADEVIHLYLARNVYDTGQSSPQGSESWIRTQWLEPTQLMQMVQTAQITDVKTIIGVFWLNQILQGSWQLK